MKSDFWDTLITELNKRTTIFAGRKPANPNYIAAKTGIPHVRYVIAVKNSGAHVELQLKLGIKNEAIIEQLKPVISKACEQNGLLHEVGGVNGEI